MDDGALRLRPHGMHMRLVCLRGLAKESVSMYVRPAWSPPGSDRGSPADATPEFGLPSGRMLARIRNMTGMVRQHPSPGSSPWLWINRTMQRYNRREGFDTVKLGENFCCVFGIARRRRAVSGGGRGGPTNALLFVGFRVWLRLRRTYCAVRGDSGAPQFCFWKKQKSG